MKRNLLWKFLFVVFVVAWSLWEMNPPTPRNLINEFAERGVNRDTNFNAIVEQARKLEQIRPERNYGNLIEAIGTNQIARYFPFVKIANEKDPNRAILQKLQQDASGQIKLGLDLQGGTSFVVGMDTSKLDSNRVANVAEREFILEQAIEVLRRRVDRFGVAEPVIQPIGDNQIEIQLPGLSEAEKETARRTIEKAAFLEFRLVHPQSEDLLSQGLTAPGYEVLTITTERAGQAPMSASYLVKKKAELGLTGAHVERAGVDSDPMSNQPGISLRFNSEGAAKFAQITRENVGNQLAIVLDGELYSAPVIQEAITMGTASINGQFTLKEAYELANVLENPLEAPVKVLNVYSVDPTLGKDSIRSGVKASIIGVILVSAFMLIYYLTAGLVANVALVLNIVILLGVMCSIDTTLTLPGIAGIVLTIGMAVDANVLIFERIREELAAGKSIRGALNAGYDKAFGTIFDSNLTTLIASVILIYLGTGPVKGFGVTLTIGVAVSMFTALVVTRLLFDWMIGKGMITTIKMMDFVGITNIDFLKYSKAAFAASWTLVLVGAIYGLYRGKDALGVDFRGGDRLTVSYAHKADIEKIRSAVNSAVGESVIQYSKDPSGVELLMMTVPFENGIKAEQVLKTQFPEAKFEVKSTQAVGPTVGQHLLKMAVIATLLSLFGILVYVAFRYEFSFAFGAVVAVIHDVLMTMGLFVLTGHEFSAPMVAAILTIIGFSINDTIVIFDRIREDLKLGMSGSFKDIINRALNQTLGRTIITSGTVLLATLSLYLFGGPVINDFAFTFLVGVITGCYSTIYIASALVLWWHKGEKPKTSTNVAIDNNVATARV